MAALVPEGPAQEGLLAGWHGIGGHPARSARRERDLRIPRRAAGRSERCPTERFSVRAAPLGIGPAAIGTIATATCCNGEPCACDNPGRCVAKFSRRAATGDQGVYIRAVSEGRSDRRELTGVCCDQGDRLWPSGGRQRGREQPGSTIRVSSGGHAARSTEHAAGGRAQSSSANCRWRTPDCQLLN